MKEIKVNRQQQREATKQKIMKAALEGFSQKGFYGTSIKDIYDSIDVASGLLYHYFPGGKEELFKTISEDALITLEAEIARHKNEFEKMPILDVLENIYQILERLFKKYGKHIKVLTVAYWMSDLSYKEEVQRMVQQSDAWLPAFLQRKSDQGEIKKPEEQANHEYSP